MTDTDLPRDQLQESFSYLSPEELARRLDSDPALLVCDVRNPDELGGELGQLPGSLNIPLGQLQQRVGELSTHKTRDIVVVCRTGKRSEAAARILLDSGFDRVFVLRGGMGKKQRREIAAALAAVPEDESRVILATGSYIGEGFDDARLDTLFLAMPISWKGTLQQYVGRLHRLHDNKRFVQVYDYVDNYVLMLARMYERRLKGYAAIGYVIDAETFPPVPPTAAHV